MFGSPMVGVWIVVLVVLFSSCSTYAFGVSPPFLTFCTTRSSITILKMNKNNNKSNPKVKQKGSRTKPQGFAGALRDIQLSAFKYAGGIRPGTQTPQRIVVEEGICKPDYADDGVPKKKESQMLPWIVEVKTQEEIVKMRAAGRVAREVLDIAGRLAVQVGVTTDEIDALVHEESIKVRKGHHSTVLILYLYIL